MDATFLVNWLMRWAHVASAAAAVGGMLLMRFAVFPILARRPEGEELVGALMPRVKRLLHIALGTALVTGFYNYIVVSIPRVRELREVNPALASYHSIMGVKILLSLVLFAIAVLLLRPVPKFQENRSGWFSVEVVLGLVILLVAAYLRRLW